MLFRNIISEVIRPDFFDFFVYWLISCSLSDTGLFFAGTMSQKWSESLLFVKNPVFSTKSSYLMFPSFLPYAGFSYLNASILYARICLSINGIFTFFVGSIAVNDGSWMIKMSSLNDNWIPRLFAWFQNEIGMGLDHEKLMRLKSRLSGVGTPHSFRNFMTKNTFRNSEPGNEAQIRNWRYGLSLASKYDDGQDFLIFAPISVNHCDDLARLVRPSTPGRAIGTFMYLIGWYHFYTS